MIPFAEKTDLICHTYYRIVGGVERCKRSGGVGKGRGSGVQERKVENRFSKHLKERELIPSM